MTNILTIYIPTIDFDFKEISCYWIFSPPENEAITGFGNIFDQTSAFNELPDFRLRVLISLDLVGRHCIELPTKSRKTAMQAVPFILEDQLVSVENMHFSLNENDTTEGLTWISVINKDILGNIIEALAKANLDPHSMTTDAALIAPNETFLLGSNIVMEDNQSNQTTLPLQLFDQQSELLPPNTWERAQSIVSLKFPDIFVCDSNQLEFASHQTISVFEFLQRDDSHENLRQGDFQRSDSAKWSFFPVQRIAICAALSCIVTVSYFVFMGLRFDAERQYNLSVAEQKYRNSFPNEKHVFDVRRQFQGHLNKHSGAGISSDIDFFALLAPFSSEIASFGDIELQKIRFKSQDGVLQSEVSAQSLADVNLLQSQLVNNKKLAAEILSVNTQSKGVRAQFKITDEQS